MLFFSRLNHSISVPGLDLYKYTFVNAVLGRLLICIQYALTFFPV